MSAPILCWVCLGRGFVRGPIHSAPCPNPICPHRPSTDAPTEKEPTT